MKINQLTDSRASLMRLADQFYKLLSIRACRQHSLTQRAVLQKFFRTLPKMELRFLTRHAIQNWIFRLNKKFSAATVRRNTSAITSFCTYLVQMGHLPLSPAVCLMQPKMVAMPVRYLKPENIAKLMKNLKNAPKKLRLMVQLAMGTGMRISEIRNLKWSSVHPKAIIVGESHPTKNGQIRTVPCPKYVIKQIQPLHPFHPDHEYLFSRMSNAAWFELLGKYNKDVPDFRQGKGAGRQFHLFRSTYATLAAKRGMDLWTLMRIMGHSSPMMTMKYVNMGAAIR